MDQKTKRDIISWAMILLGINALLFSQRVDIWQKNTNRKDTQS